MGHSHAIVFRYVLDAAFLKCGYNCFNCWTIPVDYFPRSAAKPINIVFDTSW